MFPLRKLYIAHCLFSISVSPMVNPSSDSELPCSYIPVPDGPHSDPAEPRRKAKEVLVIFCVLLALVSLVAFNGYRAHSNDVSLLLPTLLTTPKLNEIELSSPITETIPRSTCDAVSRGVSSGVSEKSNRLLNSNNVNGNGESYPWNNSMLSWQRTAYHFQPENNWMNGNFL